MAGMAGGMAAPLRHGGILPRAAEAGRALPVVVLLFLPQFPPILVRVVPQLVCSTGEQEAPYAPGGGPERAGAGQRGSRGAARRPALRSTPRVCAEPPAWRGARPRRGGPEADGATRS